jgi:hypothetical protein
MPLDAQARSIVTRAEYAMRMMRRGAALPRCHWAVRWEEEGLETRLPHVEAARIFSALTCLRARMRFEAGQGAEAGPARFAGRLARRHPGRL